MNSFSMNGYIWHVQFVEANSPMLVDRTGTRTVATTDVRTLTVYVVEGLTEDFLAHVLLHELGHCALFSFNLLNEIHRMVIPKYWVEAEEWICNFIADYGYHIFDSMFHIMGYDAWKCVPYELDRKLIVA